MSKIADEIISKFEDEDMGENVAYILNSMASPDVPAQDKLGAALCIIDVCLFEICKQKGKERDREIAIRKIMLEITNLIFDYASKGGSTKNAIGPNWKEML